MCLTFSPDGKTIASGSSDETIKLWNIQSGSEVINEEVEIFLNIFKAT